MLTIYFISNPEEGIGKKGQDNPFYTPKKLHEMYIH